MTPLLDDRWTGHFGIARFGRAVIDELPSSWRRLNGGSPWSPRLPRRDELRYSPGFNAALVGRQVLTVHDLIHLDEAAESSIQKRTYYDRVLRPAILRTRVVHTVSDYSKRRIERWLGDDRVTVVNVGNSVDTKVFGRLARDPRRGEFLYVGNLKPHKNARVLWEALKLRPDFRMTVVTSDGIQAASWTEAFGTAGQVDVVSGVGDRELADLYSRAEGLLFPSRLEGFGLPALEARVGSVPVAFASECSVVAETVGDCGVSVSESASPSAWAESMDRLSAENWTQSFDTAPRPKTWADVAATVRHSIERELNA